MQNPLFFLSTTAWNFSKGSRSKFIFVYLLFLTAEGLMSLYPILLGILFNELQKKSSFTTRSVWLYAATFLSLKILEFAIRVPARVMENKLSFDLSNNFLFGIYHMVLHLPILWHKERHSGETINRIRKAHLALKGFADGGYLYVGSIVRFVVSLTAMIYYSPAFGVVALILCFLTIQIILRFDKPYASFLNQINEHQYTVSKSLSDSLSNIMTIITLRLQQIMSIGLSSKINFMWPSMKKNLILNELRWFIVFL